MASSRSSCMSSLGLDEMERNALIQKLKKKEKKKRKSKEKEKKYVLLSVMHN